MIPVSKRCKICSKSTKSSSTVIKNEHFVNFIQTLDQCPDISENGKVTISEKYKWMKETDKLFLFLKSNVFGFVITLETSVILNLCLDVVDWQ